MPSNRLALGATTTLLLALLLSLFIHQAATQNFKHQLHNRLQHHLLVSLDSALFSDQVTAFNDIPSISYVGQQLNKAMSTMVHYRWFSALKACEVAITELDSVPIHTGFDTGQQLVLSIPINQQERPIAVGWHCQVSPLPFITVSALLLALFLLINRLTPAALNTAQKHWFSQLLKAGYNDQQAYASVSSVASNLLSLNDIQHSIFERLHNTELKNFIEAISLVNSTDLKALDQQDLPWLIKGLDINNDLSAAFSLAKHRDQIEIDLPNAQLRIHGLTIPTTKTPLFYYALYASEKCSSDGWITNPASNRPDRQRGAQLAELMWKHNGHAKAISDLEDLGLKAKILDQNRSKIKDDIAAILGEELAAPYLLETQRDIDTGRMRYRLAAQAKQITVNQ